MPSGLICIVCRFGRENQVILARLWFETRMGQGREIVGGKCSSFTPPPFEYSSINHTSSECNQPSHEDQKVAEQVIDKELLHLKFGSQASLDLRKSLGTSVVYVERPRASLGFKALVVKTLVIFELQICGRHCYVIFYFDNEKDLFHDLVLS